MTSKNKRLDILSKLIENKSKEKERKKKRAVCICIVHEKGFFRITIDKGS